METLNDASSGGQCDAHHNRLAALAAASRGMSGSGLRNSLRRAGTQNWAKDLNPTLPRIETMRSPGRLLMGLGAVVGTIDVCAIVQPETSASSACNRLEVVIQIKDMHPAPARTDSPRASPVLVRYVCVSDLVHVYSDAVVGNQHLCCPGLARRGANAVSCDQ